jgi:hypothetical protein
LGLIGVALWLGETSLAQIGFGAPQNWLTTLALGLILGSALALFSIALLEPWIERLTGQPHDVSLLESVRGNWKALLGWLVMIWGVVAFVEETIYRGFLMNEIARFLGTGAWAATINVIFTSAVFGLSHSYQGRSGAWSTGLIGILLAILFIWNGYNLWLLIFVHGFIDTVALALMSAGIDKRLQESLWKINLTRL